MSAANPPPSPSSTDSLDAWFDEIFNKACSVDLREITSKNGHQPESTMYLWQLKEAIETYVTKRELAIDRAARVDELNKCIEVAGEELYHGRAMAEENDDGSLTYGVEEKYFQRRIADLTNSKGEKNGE